MLRLIRLFVFEYFKLRIFELLLSGLGLGIRPRISNLIERSAVKFIHRRVDRSHVDERINYPCYKSLDSFIDIERLKALDADIVRAIERRTQDNKFHTGALTLGKNDDRIPGGCETPLTVNKNPTYNYYELDQAELWEPSAESTEFSGLMDFISSLPFRSTGRMVILYDTNSTAVTAHRDHARLETCHEFIWFRTRLSKPFYLMNHRTKERKYVESYSAWFDTINQFHGADAAPGLSISIRVDGKFTDEFRSRIPVPNFNAASTAPASSPFRDRPCAASESINRERGRAFNLPRFD